MAINPNVHTPRPDRRRAPLKRYAGNIAATLLVTLGVAAGLESIREIGTYELRDKPALKGKVSGVKAHQNNLRSLVEDGEVRLRGIEGTPYNAVNVAKLRKLAQQKNGIDQAIPPVVTHEEFKGGGSFTATNFASELSRQTVVSAVETTIQDTKKTKLDKAGLDDIFAQYQDNLAEARGAAVQQEEAAIAAGLQAAAQTYNEALDDKPILVDSGYAAMLRKDAGLVLVDGALHTARYNEDANTLAPPIEVLPNTLDEAVGELYGRPSLEDLQIKLPKEQ